MVNREAGASGAPQQENLAFRRAIAEQVNERIGWIDEAAAAIGGEGARVEDVFPPATETRKDAPVPNWDDRQIAEVREVAHRFGYGAEQDVHTGLSGGRRIAEGGLYWKMLAEDKVIDGESAAAAQAVEQVAARTRGEVVSAEPPAPATEVIYAVTPHRALLDGEREVIQKDIAQLSVAMGQKRPDNPKNVADHVLLQVHRAGLMTLLRPDATEYDLARVLAERRAAESLRGTLEELLHLKGTGFNPFQAWAEHRAKQSANEDVLPFGYRVLPDKRIEATSEATGQLRQIGTSSSGERVRLLRVDRLDVTKPDSEKPQYSQPDTAALMGFIAGVADGENAPQDPIGLVTSNSYASRVPDAMRAGLVTGHLHNVAMYGRATLAETKHAPIQPETPELNQLPGEMRNMHDKLLALWAELGVEQQ